MDANEFRDLGHEVVELLSNYLDHIEEKRVFPDVEPRTLHAFFSQSLPENPSPPQDVLAELEQKLLPYCTHVGHPGYMGLITPSPNPIGVIADFICSALNQNVGAYSIGPSAVALERRAPQCRVGSTSSSFSSSTSPLSSARFATSRPCTGHCNSA